MAEKYGVSRSSPFALFKAGQVVGAAAAVIALAIASAFLGLTVKQDEMIRNYIEIAARNYFESIVITRRWNADHGGVYVQKREGMRSNPYLAAPDITTTDGHVFIMKNPALMTREISEMAKEAGGYQYHITSLKLLNPANAPDVWERESLSRFERGVAETTSIAEVNGKKVFRLMRPLFYEEGCVGCHGKQGYSIGDVRGGISVALPYGSIASSLKANRLQMFGLAVVILFCFLAVFYLGVWRLMSRLAAINSSLVEEREKLARVNAAMDQAIEDRTAELREANEGLQRETAERRAMEERMRELNAELEQRILMRTTEAIQRAEELNRSQQALLYLLEDVNEAKKELEDKVAEIERLNRLFVKRELRMKELKEKIKKQEAKRAGPEGEG